MDDSDNRRILIDADGCPVVDITIRLAKECCVECLILCDTSHAFVREGAETLTFSKGADSVDFALVNMINSGDIVITQDYGLAAMCLARNATVLNQDGKVYSADNIDGLLNVRHISRKVRSSGGRFKGPPKRTPEQDEQFRVSLRRILEHNTNEVQAE